MSSAEQEERVAQAGEYVLGTLTGPQRQAFEARLSQEPDLLAEVYFWQDQLLGLSGRIEALSPHPALWGRIEASLTTAKGAAPPEAANDSRWQSARFWRWTSALAVAASLLMATALVWRQQAPTLPEVRYLAVLQSPTDKSTGWVVEASARQLRLVPMGQTAAVPGGKALQFWTKAEGASGPTSLGLIKPGQVTVVPMDRLPQVGERQLFELTLEPETGSPIGKPTGPILFIGRAKLL